ncbi:hypothetical protein [Holophaga foetida]|uniref:hypothetical protein n=1 Tax=Holophaga foetida TaxID=35839 RepID=UPI0002471CA7|nr:hypothetical protein [Holophaga foetida]
MRAPALLLAASLPLALLVACGGGGGSSSSSGPVLTYTNNASATSSDWRVEVDSATNGSSTLLLRVYGPTGTAVQGATVFLSCNAARTEWVQPSGATDAYALEGSALDFTQGPTTGVQLFKSRLSGSDLQVGAYQKTGTQALTASKPLFSVALSPVSGATAGAASLAATSGKTSIYLDSTGEHELTLKVGTLVVE